MIHRVSVKVGETETTFETGRIARQAHGSVLTTRGDTMVLACVCVSPDLRPDQDFFPLTVEYRERSSSAGRIPGNFFRREGRPSEREVLVSRLTDRPLRPLFPRGFLNEVQVFSTVFSADNENNPDVMSINAVSAALHISKVPFCGPIGAVRVAMLDGELAANPPMSRMKESILDVVMAGTRDDITMVEGQALDISEEIMVRALEFGHGHIRTICDHIDEYRARAGVKKMPYSDPKPDPEVVADVERLTGRRFEEILTISEKLARHEAMEHLQNEVFEKLTEHYGPELFQQRVVQVRETFEETAKRLMRRKVLDTHVRIDGRRPEEIRPISIEVGVLPRAHGSALFTRGETQALVSTTLGTSRDEQRLDELTGEEFRRFMLHYNFPPYSVGEVRMARGPGRREIGHGKLAERAIERVVPVNEEAEFPYTIRVLSDITESNGSSSMATVCGGTLSLMDAGVPIRTPVAGIAMGLIKEGDQASILSDIMGTEDHLGDMDFKVCGTRNGITAFQMDVKTSGITSELMMRALEQARAGRVHILDKMEEVLPAPRPDISPYAPRIYTIQIAVEQIREIIGPGGKVVREIQAKTGAEIEIQDDGTINVAAVNEENAKAAIEIIRGITATPEVGQIYRGAVSRLMNFGAFVTIMGNKEGLVHISELSIEHVREVGDVVKVGDEINVKLVEIDKMGRLNLSKVEADRELGLLPDPGPDGHPPRERSSRDRDRGSRPHSSPRRGGGGGGGGRDRDRDRPRRR